MKKRALKARPGEAFKAKLLFAQDPVSARLCRKFFEDVSMGRFKNIKTIGTKSSDGYIAI